VKNFMAIYLMGYAFGTEVVFTYQMAFILSASYLIAKSYISGYGLSNSKSYMESKKMFIFL